MTRPPSCPALVVDLDGVLRHFDPAATARAEGRAALPAGVLDSFAFAPLLLGPALTGAVTDQQWRYRTAQELAGLFGEVAAADAVTEWAAHPGVIDLDVLDLVRRVRVPVILFTNATTRLEADLEAAGLSTTFAAVVSSARVGVAKPDSGAFEAAERAVAAVADGRRGPVVYIDDSSANIAAARDRGWRAWRFTGADRLHAFLDRQRLLASSDDLGEPARRDVEHEPADGVAERKEFTGPNPGE